MIRCCNGCPARRPRCHCWGECVHWMNEKTARNQHMDEKIRMHAGDYNSFETFKKNSGAYLGARYNKRRTGK